MSAVQPLQASTVFDRMASLTGLHMTSDADILRIVKAGVSASTYKRVARALKLPPSLVAPESTIRRRLTGNARFTEAETERVIRLARVYAEAMGLFEDKQRALHWLRTPATYVSGEPPITPLALAATDSGARLIESHIQRAIHGIF